MISKIIKIFSISILLFSCNNDDELEQTDSDFEIKTAGYYLDEKEVEEEFEEAIYDTLSDFKKSIIRNFTNQEEKKLISIAESLYPNKDSIFNIGNVIPDAIDITDSNLWWYAQFDGVKIPYATSRSTVKYYNDLIDFYRAGDFESAGTIVNSSAELTYQATINFENDFTIDDVDFKNVYVVNLEINWFSFCGSLCALWVDSTRTIVFDVEKNRVYIYGDGPIPIEVS